MSNRTTPTDFTSANGYTRRDVMKGFLASLAGAGLMPRAARGAPQQGIATSSSELLWQVSAPDPKNLNLYDLPAYVNGNIIFTVQNPNTFQGGLYWLDVQSQQYRTSALFNYFLFTPVMLNGVLYAAANTGGLYALDPATGNSLWPKPAPYKIAADVASINGMLVFPATNGMIVALDGDGNQLWAYSTGQSVGASQASRATLLNGVIIVSFFSTVFGVDPDTGAFLWKFTASDLIVGDLAVSSNAVHFSTRDQKVFSLKSDGTLAWNWPSAQNPVNASLGSPAVNAEVVYVADGSGGFHALNAIDGTSAWPPIMLSSGASRAKIFIEDGVAYVSAGPLLGDCTLYAIDLTSKGGKVISQDAGIGGTFLGVENGVAYFVRDSGNNVAAADFAGQIHSFFCESQLMVEDYASSTNSDGFAANNTSYRTHLQLLDPNYNPRPGKTVKVWASDTATLSSGGQTYTIDNSGNSAMLQTDGNGELSLVVSATDLSCPALYLWGNFMDTGESLVVYPDNSSLLQLSQVDAGSLQQATDYEGNLLVPDLASATALANTLTNAMAGGPAQNSPSSSGRARIQLSGPSQSSRPGRRPRRPVSGAPNNGNSYVAYPGQTPNLWHFPDSSASADRSYGTAANPNWEATFGASGISFTPTIAPAPGVRPLALQSHLSFHDLLRNVVHGVENVTKIVYQTVENVVNVIVETAENIYNVTVSAVEHAIAVVASAIKTAVKDIKRAIQWLSYLFNWKEILATKEQIKTDFASGLANLKAWLTAQQGDGFKGLHAGLQGANVQTALAAPPAPLTQSMQSQQVDNNNPQDLYNMGGANSYTQSRFLTTKVQDNASQAQFTGDSATLSASRPADFAPSASSASDAFNAAVGTFFSTVANKVGSDSRFQAIPTDIVKMLDNLKNLFTDPSQFVKSSQADIAKLIKDIAGTLVTLADAVLEGLVQFFVTVVDLIVDLLNTQIKIPFVSELYQLIAKSPLTLLDLVALMVAVPTHIISAAISAPLSSSKAVAHAKPSQQKISWYCACYLQTIFFSAGDFANLGGVPIVGSIIAAVNCLPWALGFPSDFATNTDYTYIYYGIKGIPPVLGIFNTVVQKAAGSSAFGTTLKKVAPWVVACQGAATMGMAITWAVQGKPGFTGVNYLKSVTNCLHDTPFLFKPLATGDPFSPGRIAASLIDAVSFDGAVTIAIVEQSLEP
jgi:outer membrane protein assembly factor BamB